MMSKQFINNIEEIRIEGHTSSVWEGEPDRQKAYFKNMTLSQERTRATLEYIMTCDKINLREDQKEWLMKHFSAIGFSSGHPLSNKGTSMINGESEDYQLSQRVEFRVRTNIERKVADIVEK